jgi:hypothetical protein
VTGIGMPGRMHPAGQRIGGFLNQQLVFADPRFMAAMP